MKDQSVYIKRYPNKGQLPKEKGWYITNKGIFFLFPQNKDYIIEFDFWLEEVEIPNEQDVNKFWCQKFKKGAMYILRKFK